MDRPGGTVIVTLKLVGAGPASECQSTIPLDWIPMFDAVAKFVRKLSRDPAAAWPSPTLDHVVIDTTAQTICGVKLPCDPAQLRKIGRPSNRHSFVERVVQYDDLGTMFWFDRAGRVADVGACLIDSGSDGPPARRIDVVGRCGRCELTPGSRVETLAAVVGDGRVDGPDDNPVWTFRLGSFDMTAECGQDGTLRYLHYFAV